MFTALSLRLLSVMVQGVAHRTFAPLLADGVHKFLNRLRIFALGGARLDLLEIHEMVAPLMWAYLIGHVAIALFHELRGERIIAAMLSISNSK